MLKLNPAFIILAVTSEGTTPAKYSDTYFHAGLCEDGLPIFDTQERAAEELPKIAERYYERGTVPTFVIAPCFVPDR